jgi:ribosomal protein S12 methylthiotransferase accessory factor
MLRRPRFKHHFRVQTVPQEGVFLLSAEDQTVLQGRLYELVAPCLDGRPMSEVCAELRGAASPAQIYYTVSQLEKKGYLAENEESLSPGETALWSSQDVDPAQAARRLADTPVAVRAVGEVDAKPFCALLQSLHVRVEDSGPLQVVLTDSYLRPDLRACNREALQSGRPWLLVRAGGAQSWLGPLFRPGHTGCWGCLAERLRANSPVAGYLEKVGGDTGTTIIDPCQTAATLQVAWGLAATAVASWVVSGALERLEGKVQTLDLLTGEAQTHTLLRQPSCPECGERASAELPVEAVVLNRCKKTFTEDGGHRALSPQQTLDRYGHHVSPITGAVSMLQRDGDNGEGVMHVYLSGHNVARRPKTWGRLRSELRDSSCGKGTTDLQARASALCEGLERYSAVFRGNEPRRRARLVDLPDAVHPNTSMLYSDRQYREREEWNARDLAYDEVPHPFNPEAEIDWTPVWSLTHQAVRYLPTAFCYFNYPHKCAERFCSSDSNGNAAGNTREEAILQGFLELVERDAVALWWYNRVRLPGVDLDSFGDPYLPALRAYLARQARTLWVLDLTSDLGIPVFASLSGRTDGPAEQILFGFGAHLDARIALLRAVTEMNQMLGPVLGLGPGDPPGAPFSDRATSEWLRTATVANQPYLQPQDGPARTASCYPACTTDDIRDDVLACQRLVERQGMEVLVLDHTRPEIGLPVVKVVVPGLRHFWARFAPGRLYDAPVRLGWLAQPLAEEQFNPAPMFL